MSPGSITVHGITAAIVLSGRPCRDVGRDELQPGVVLVADGRSRRLRVVEAGEVRADHLPGGQRHERPRMPSPVRPLAADEHAGGGTMPSSRSRQPAGQFSGGGTVGTRPVAAPLDQGRFAQARLAGRRLAIPASTGRQEISGSRRRTRRGTGAKMRRVSRVSHALSSWPMTNG